MQNGNGKLIFDIDNTLCVTIGTDYENAIPNLEVINKINKFYDLGYKIILNTARGYETGINWYKLTKTQLDNWGVKYHKLILGKPSGDLYIDDKACNIIDWEPIISCQKQIDKSWGKEYLLFLNKFYAMKRLEIEPKKNLSLQYHNKKEETMHVVSGKGIAKIGEKILNISTGDTLKIPANTIH